MQFSPASIRKGVVNIGGYSFSLPVQALSFAAAAYGLIFLLRCSEVLVALGGVAALSFFIVDS